MKNNMEDNRNITISLAIAKEWYKGNNNTLKELALHAFTESELQENTCVKSWSEFCERYNSIIHEYYIDSITNIVSISRDCRDVKADKNLLATKEDAEAFLALMQLKRLRDQWWEALDWKPDYINNAINNYGIVLIENKIKIGYIYSCGTFLAFPTKEVAEDFLNCFKHLIEKAKNLL